MATLTQYAYVLWPQPAGSRHVYQSWGNTSTGDKTGVLTDGDPGNIDVINVWSDGSNQYQPLKDQEIHEYPAFLLTYPGARPGVVTNVEIVLTASGVCYSNGVPSPDGNLPANFVSANLWGGSVVLYVWHERYVTGSSLDPNGTTRDGVYITTTPVSQDYIDWLNTSDAYWMSGNDRSDRNFVWWVDQRPADAGRVAIDSVISVSGTQPDDYYRGYVSVATMKVIFTYTPSSENVPEIGVRPSTRATYKTPRVSYMRRG